jgi:hypothetical protein
MRSIVGRLARGTPAARPQGVELDITARANRVKQIQWAIPQDVARKALKK